MIKPIAIATILLAATAIPALAQGGNPPSAPPPRARLPTAIGPTGTMYDGNNANLQLPSERNAYWEGLWANPRTTGNAGPAAAVGAGTAGTSLGGAQTGGQH